MSPDPSVAAPAAPPATLALVPAAPVRLPFDYLDTLCLAGTSAAHGVSSAPVWQLEIAGAVDEAVLRDAVAALARRYPVLAARAVAPGGGALERARRLAYEVDPAPDLGRLCRVVDLRGDAAGLERVRAECFDTCLDLAAEYPARVTFARTAADRGVLFFQQHHGIADGAAFFALLQDLCRCYDGQGSAALAPVPKLPEAEVAEPDPGRRRRARWAGYLYTLWDLVRALVRPPDPLRSNVGDDFTGHNRVLHLELDEAVLARCRRARAAGLSVNDLLTGALALALSRWTRAAGLPLRRFSLMLLADMRPRDREVRSFANHLSSYVVDLDLRRGDGALALTRAVHDSVRRQAARRLPLKRLLAGIALVRRFRLGTLRRAVFGARRATLNTSFSNLLPLWPGGRLATRAWTCERLLIMTPCLFRQGLNASVIHYAGRLCFNFNYKESIVDAASARLLVDGFAAALDETLAEAAP
ncbi:MAG TPA: condensation domain-containing protein [Polyangia bacterium]|jgi:hypothetical protein